MILKLTNIFSPIADIFNIDIVNNSDLLYNKNSRKNWKYYLNVYGNLLSINFEIKKIDNMFKSLTKII